MQFWECIRHFVLLILFHVTLSGATECGFPGKPANGQLDLSYFNGQTFPPGTAVTYSCRGAHFVLIGESIRICQENGKWSSSRPVCDLNIAGGKTVKIIDQLQEHDDLVLTDGQFDAVSSSLGAEDKLQLDLGQVYDVKRVIFHLQADAASSVMDGQVVLDDQECPTLYKTDTKIIFKCKTPGRLLEFRYSGTDALNIHEIQIFPEIMECGTPEIPSNCDVTIGKRGRFPYATYGCKEGYELMGDGKRICYEGRWHGQQPVCKPTTLPEALSLKFDVFDEDDSATVPPIATRGSRSLIESTQVKMATHWPSFVDEISMDDISWVFILLTVGVSVLCALLIGIGVAMIYKMSKMSRSKEPLLSY